MSWHALAYVVAIVIMAFVLLVLWAWPRDVDGKLMSVEDAEQHLKRFPMTPTATDQAKYRIAMVFLILVMIGVALTEHATDEHNYHD